MELKVNIDTKALVNAMRKSPDQMREGLNLALIKIGNKLSAEAKTDHGYTRRSGSLQRDTGYKILNTQTGFLLRFGLGNDPTNASSKYGYVIHEGCDPYVIVPKDKKALAFNGIVVKKVNHPGIKKDQFIYEAAKNNKQYINRELDTAIKKVTKGF